MDAVLQTDRAASPTHPEWYEDFDLSISDLGQPLLVDVLDGEHFSVVQHCEVELSELVAERTSSHWIDLWTTPYSSRDSMLHLLLTPHGFGRSPRLEVVVKELQLPILEKLEGCVWHVVGGALVLCVQRTHIRPFTTWKLMRNDKSIFN